MTARKPHRGRVTTKQNKIRQRTTRTRTPRVSADDGEQAELRRSRCSGRTAGAASHLLASRPNVVAFGMTAMVADVRFATRAAYWLHALGAPLGLLAVSDVDWPRCAWSRSTPA
jgi:hypothetical protein